MKVIIAGSRDLKDRDGFFALIEKHHKEFKITEVVSGKCPTGGDRFGEEWAASKRIPVRPFPADWKAHGKAAGPIRNKKMAEYADALIVMTLGKTRGSFNMIDNMEKLKKPVRWEMRFRQKAVTK